MKDRLRIVLVHKIVCLLFLLSGCTLLSPAFPPQEKIYSDLSEIELLQKINGIENAADTKEELITLIQLHGLLVEKEINKAKNLSAIADYYILLGASYATDPSEKQVLYMAAIAHAEKLMMLNEKFSNSVRNGIEPWDALETLTANEVDGMGRWSTAALFYFRECIPNYRRIFSVKWVNRSKKMMDRIEQLNPEWMNGANYFNLAIYYHALPEIAGGSRAMSAHYLAEAEKIGGNRSLFSWGKAKYIYTTYGNEALFDKSLNKILSASLDDDSAGDDRVDPYAWRVYFHREASQLLSKKDMFF